MEWENVSICNFCGHDSVRLYMKARVEAWYPGRPLRLVECRKCHLVFANPRPVFHEHYPGKLAGGESAEEAFETKRNRANVMRIHDRHVSKAIEHLGRPATSLFDIGFGAGTVMEVAASKGLEAWGNEINAYSVEEMRRRGFEAFVSRTSDINIDRRFDIVMHLDCLEHSYEPFDELKVCLRLLEPGGILFLKTLYLNSATHRAEGENWRLFGAGHYHFFTPDVLLNMVREAGFDIEFVETPNLIFVIARKPGGAVLTQQEAEEGAVPAATAASAT